MEITVLGLGGITGIFKALAARVASKIWPQW